MRARRSAINPKRRRYGSSGNRRRSCRSATTSAERNITGYLSGFSSPSVTEYTIARASSPTSNSAGQTRLPTFSITSRSIRSSGRRCNPPAPSLRRDGTPPEAGTRVDERNRGAEAVEAIHVQARRDVALRQHLTSLCDAVDLPVNADLESGFASDPEGVATNVGLAVQAGVAGSPLRIATLKRRLLSTTGPLPWNAPGPLALRSKSGGDIILVARTEGLLSDPTAIAPAIDSWLPSPRLCHCLYAPGVRGKADIAAMVRAVAPRPLNVLVMDPGLSVAELAELGVRRISVGGALARVAWAAVGNGRKDQGWFLRRFGRRSIRQAVERRLQQLQLRSNRIPGRSCPSTMFGLAPPAVP